MPRFFASPEQIQETVIVLNGSDINHIRNVLRMSVGDEMTISDGCGRDYFCEISTLSSDAVELVIKNSWDSYSELPVKLYLFQGLPKADKMELIIQKAVELGVYAVIPVEMMRSVVKLDTKKAAKKQERWQEIARSAAKQSGRGQIPEVMAPVSFKAALKLAAGLDALLLPYEGAEGMTEARSLVQTMKGKQSIGIFIGPEGGFDLSEVEAAQAAGAGILTLGRRILRTETAGMAILSILMFELERR